tara:strand:+ start:631 stop:1239 length:609 start_codon:yes stop_codon:yes gene_type:complete
MAVNVKVNVSNKAVYTLILVIVIAVLGTFTFAQTGGGLGHDASQISVIIKGTEKTLQEAVDGDLECNLFPKFVGVTTTGYTGNLGGYSGGDAKCAGEFTGSHMCSSEELLRSVKCGGTAVETTEGGWYKTGVMRHITWDVQYNINDCRSFKSDYYNDGQWNQGMIWYDNSYSGGYDEDGVLFTHVGPLLEWCNANHKIMCCK